MTSFDPNSASTNDSGIFGLPYSAEEAQLVLLPVPWEATTSYGGGTSQGPRAILEASRQVDLYDGEVLKPYEAGLYWIPESADILALNERAKQSRAKKIIASGGVGNDATLSLATADVNTWGETLNQFVFTETKRWLEQNKIVGIVGGDHSVPFGAFRAVAQTNPEFGILHFDAHSDTRIAYEGFTWSHASIMYNVLENIPQVTRLVQVGVRDFCEQEIEYCQSQKDRVRIFFDADNARKKMEGATWATITHAIIQALPQNVWISFDVDGLDPRFCPGTGTPVPGGLDFHEANYLIRKVVESGKKILGFDLNEVAPSAQEDNTWDANVGARLLYKLCAWTLVSQGKAKKVS